MKNASHVLVVDANNPADILDVFPVSTSHILCLTSVPGLFLKQLVHLVGFAKEQEICCAAVGYKYVNWCLQELRQTTTKEMTRPFH